MDLEDEEFLHSKLRTKGKSQNYLLKSEILELKPRTRRQGKCFGAALEYLDAAEDQSTTMEGGGEAKTYTYISNDIWFHLSNYIAPEDVQRFALICSQSANTVNTCSFWLQLLRRYCPRTKGKYVEWNLEVPLHLQMEFMNARGKIALRQNVIQCLFHCYAPFKERLTKSYNLETLVGRTCLSSWHRQAQCIWIMCYKFRINFPLAMASSKQKTQSIMENDNLDDNDDVVNDWESLAEESNNSKIVNTSNTSPSPSDSVNDLDGVSLLVICCDRFIPFPSDILYSNATCPFRLAATRELLSTDMRSMNLELDFISSTRDQTITVKYTKIKKYKVLPWWHPDFRILNQCE